MPISGSEIVKMLPKTKGCKDCGFPTCFAFAMKLASGGATVDRCPHLSEETKAKLIEALAPPMRLVTIGTEDNKLEIGNEEVVYSCLLYTSPSPRDRTRSRMPSSA